MKSPFTTLNSIAQDLLKHYGITWVLERPGAVPIGVLLAAIGILLLTHPLLRQFFAMLIRRVKTRRSDDGIVRVWVDRYPITVRVRPGQTVDIFPGPTRPR